MALNQRNEFLRKPQVIAALKLLVDYDGIANQLLAGTEVVHQSFLPHGVLGASDDNPFRFDPARAKALLEQAGLGAGFAIGLDTIGAAPWLDIAQALQAGFARAGVRLEIRPGDEKEVLTKYRARRHDIFLGPWGSDYPDPQSNAQAFIGGEDLSDNATLRTLAWRNSWKNADLSHRLDAAAAEPDIAKREMMYRALQRDHQAIAPFVMMFQDVAVAAHRNTVGGFILGASPDHTLYAGIEKR
jgi:peptide/nickel transport system substrate-binding protein